MTKTDPKKFTVEPEHSDWRLDQFLAKTKPAKSRMHWQRIIRSGCVSINNQVSINPNKTLKTNDQVIVKIPASTGPLKQFNLPILFEHPDWLIIDKPSGLLSHAKGRETDESTVATLLADKIDDDGTNRAGIVHRLDRGTSGLMVVAKHKLAHTELQRLFSERKVDKYYLALVNGIVIDDEAELTWPIGRNPKLPSQFRADLRGKTASTRLSVISRLKGITELILNPKTGRTHQLRVHLVTYGHPIIGDVIYAPPQITSLASRLCLHATKLEFKYGSKQFQFESSWPEEVVEIRKKYEK